MHPHLEGLTLRSGASTRRVTETRATLALDQLAWRPDPATWSFLDCLNHLVLTASEYAPFIGRALESAARPQSGFDAPYRPTWFGKRFIEALGPQSKRTARAPGIFAPAGGSADGELVERFFETQSQIENWIGQADGLPLNGPKFRSPVTFLIRLTIGEGLTLLVAHTERHVNQAVGLTRYPGFPSS